MEPDDELIAACRTGDPAAWERLVGRYHRLIRSIAFSYGLSRDDAEEIVQVVFSIVVAQLDRFRPGTVLSAWLGVVTRRHVWRVLEQHRREDVTSVGDVFDTAIESHEGGTVESQWLHAAIARLSPRCRALLEALYLGDDPSYDDISAVLQIPIGSIGPTRARCLNSLRDLLGLGATAGGGSL